MNTIPAGSPAHFTIREAAWILGVNPSKICRAIRTGTLPTVRRRARKGSCAWLYQHDLEPEWTGDDLTDREVAARICANCQVRQECLELELRSAGDQTLGVSGALPAEDVRAVFPVWLARRRRRGGERGGRP